MKKLFLSTLLLALPLLSSAYDAEVDGIYYNLNSEEKTAEVTYQNYENSDYSESVIIPETISYEGVEYKVTSLGNDAFRLCRNLKSVIIPNSVTRIGSNVFGGCARLTSVIIGNSVKSIEKEAFYNCQSLSAITIPNSVTSIGYSTNNRPGTPN